jgi:hypothetical protein
MSFKNAKETAGDIFMLLVGIGAIGGLIYAIIQVSKGNFQDYKEDNREPFVSAGSIIGYIGGALFGVLALVCLSLTITGKGSANAAMFFLAFGALSVGSIMYSL